jgi:hypothetical protein
VSLERSSREADKVRAYLANQLALKQKYERIDYKHDVIHPIIDALKAGKPVLGLPEAMTLDNIELKFIDDHSDPKPEA